MKSMLVIFAFVAMTFLCWGSYGPVLHRGQELMTGENAIDLARLRPFICVGLAYFVIAVVVPVTLLKMKGEQGQWSASGLAWSMAAGIGTAIGALGIVLAFAYRGNPAYVMPLVFGGAPVVNTFVSMWMAGSYRQAGKIFYAGLVLVVAGAVTVLINKPEKQGPHVDVLVDGGTIQVTTEVRGKKDGTEQTTTTSTTQTEQGSYQVIEVKAAAGGGSPRETRSIDKTPEGRYTVKVVKQGDKTDTSDYTAVGEKEMKSKSGDDGAHRAFVSGMKQFRRYSPVTYSESVLIALSVAATIVCWGAYGPLLHKGQMAMGGSRLRPLLCVGIAYFGVAVFVPALLLSTMESQASFTPLGTTWSLIAGVAGAGGSLGVIMAFNFGGKPIYVMPLVFGGAPVVNTIISVVQSASYGQIGPFFFAGLVVVILGAVTVLVFAPRGAPPPKKT